MKLDKLVDSWGLFPEGFDPQIEVNKSVRDSMGRLLPMSEVANMKTEVDFTPYISLDELAKVNMSTNPLYNASNRVFRNQIHDVTKEGTSGGAARMLMDARYIKDSVDGVPYTVENWADDLLIASVLSFNGILRPSTHIEFSSDGSYFLQDIAQAVRQLFKHEKNVWIALKSLTANSHDSRSMFKRSVFRSAMLAYCRGINAKNHAWVNAGIRLWRAFDGGDDVSLDQIKHLQALLGCHQKMGAGPVLTHFVAEVMEYNFGDESTPKILLERTGESVLANMPLASNLFATSRNTEREFDEKLVSFGSDARSINFYSIMDEECPKSILEDMIGGDFFAGTFSRGVNNSIVMNQPDPNTLKYSGVFTLLRRLWMIGHSESYLSWRLGLNETKDYDYAIASHLSEGVFVFSEVWDEVVSQLESDDREAMWQRYE